MQLITEEFHLLSDQFATRSTPFRPPWAVAERPFVLTCDQCGKCVDACPEHVLTYGRGDFPVMDFTQGGCTFCGACADVCEQGGLNQSERHPWNQRAFIAKTCLANTDEECDACGSACPAAAISFRPQVGHKSVPILEEMLCTGCGTCVSVCPSQAIKVFSLA